MKNKWLFLVIAAAVLILGFVRLASADESATCSPTIQLVSQDPVPAVPDSNLKVVFEVTNIDDSACNGLSVKLEPTYPFSLDPNSNAVQSIQSSPYTQNYQQGWTVPYTLKVASDAVQGNYNLPLFWTAGSTGSFDGSSVEKDFNISITDSQTDFATVIQQVSGTQVSIGVVNTGKNTANSIIVSVPQQNDFRTSGISQQIVGNLAAGDYTLVNFNVIPNFSRNLTGFSRNSTQQAAAQNLPTSHTLKIQIDYTDGIGQRRTITKDIAYDSTLLVQGNTTATTGQYGMGASRTSAATSSTRLLEYAVAIAAALVIAGLVYRKLRKKHKNKNSNETPDWVVAERHQKK
jgi:hypothetical protein